MDKVKEFVVELIIRIKKVGTPPISLKNIAEFKLLIINLIKKIINLIKNIPDFLRKIKNNINVVITKPPPKIFFCPLIKEDCVTIFCQLWNKDKNECLMITQANMFTKSKLFEAKDEL